MRERKRFGIVPVPLIDFDGQNQHNGADTGNDNHFNDMLCHEKAAV